jgi:hypothetical protein
MGAYTEIVDFTFTANETSRAFTGLNITKDDFIKIVVTQVNGSSSDSILSLFPNTTAGVSGFDTQTNYHRQTLNGSGSTVSSARVNNNLAGFVLGSSTAINYIFIKISENGKYNGFSLSRSALDSNIALGFAYTTSSNLTFNDPITSLTFTAGETDGLGDGSRIQIYRLDAEKVADFTTTSNSTQVDIPFPSGTFDPAINKDSEYLLVSDVVENSSSGAVFMTPNDLTTLTGYYFQRIVGDGTTPIVDRQNNSRIGFIQNRSLIYTHIKLSEIGAYTHQSYLIQNYGSSAITLQNTFVSSTAENITSITKLNVIAATTNGIGSGSRFILYKLK